ncbi:ATP-grasp domain-containing protein [uncultured Methanobrevibacter sp.]|uniref:ATP-grasp domain-containing protein n=1 Tax=uncultured Methanobrevibacter sp. TaxID=253161 RepID=UPI0025FCA180|nr:ATP-grasp domain-containing protein [uncultured Methanobrevibacter sp.]
MEKLLLIGINTRSMLKSALKLDYEVFSTSYFSTSDTPAIKNQKIILEEKDNESSGVFEDNFDGASILDISRDYIDEVDYIIPISGISPNDFTKKDQKKILGNKNTSNIEDKFKFYKKIKDEFKVPETFLIKDVDEAIEISENKSDVKYIVKPLKGSGGYNINLLNNDGYIQLNDGEKFILQEYIEGINLSSSVLGSDNYKKTIMNSRLLTEHDFKKNNSYIYIGNILPLTKESILTEIKDIDKINSEMIETSQNLAYTFDLIGSNGVDYILNENGLYVIEINPRIQGTFECIEKSLQINMLDAHIKSCLNENVDIPEAKYYAYKKIIYSPCRNKYSKIDLDNIYDLPHIGTITEKSEPLLTIIDKNTDFDKLYKKIEKSAEIVNNEAKKYQQDAI